MVKINKNRQIENFLIIVIFGIMLCSIVSAVGYSSPYVAGTTTPLTIAPGETKTVKILSLQAAPQEGTIIYKVILVENGGIATLIEPDKEYQVFSGASGVVSVKLKAPDDAVEGDIYTIKLDIKDVTPSGGGGTVGVSIGASATIPVLVKIPPPAPTETPAAPEEESNAVWWIIGIIIVIAVILAIYLLLKSKKK